MDSACQDIKKCMYMCIFNLTSFINLYKSVRNSKFQLLSWQQNWSRISFSDFALVIYHFITLVIYTLNICVLS